VSASDGAGHPVSASDSVTSAPHGQVALRLVLGELLADGGGGGDLADGGGAVGCAALGASVLACEDFESGAPASIWFPGQTQGTVTVDTSRPHRGLYAMHSQTSAAASGATVKADLTESSSFPAPPSLFVRAWYYLPVQPASGFEITGVAQQASPYAGLAVYQTGGFLSVQNTVNGAFHASNSVPFPSGRWTCLEWEVDFAGTQQYRFWIDGSEVTDLHIVEPTQPSPPVNLFGTGLDFYGLTAAQPAYELWIDDLILSSSRIGCAP
jgi:hypothetical protein